MALMVRIQYLFIFPALFFSPIRGYWATQIFAAQLYGLYGWLKFLLLRVRQPEIYHLISKIAGFEPMTAWPVQSLCVLIILIKQSANTSDGRILLHMSIMVWKIDKSTISRLTFPETDFDSITKQLPSGLYTTFRTFAQHTKVIGLSVHLARLYQPAKAQGLVIVRTQRKLRQILAQLLNSMGTDEARLRIVLDTTSEPGTLYVMMQVFQVLPEKLYHEGPCVALSARSREEPKLKKTQFILPQPLSGNASGEMFLKSCSHTAAASWKA